MKIAVTIKRTTFHKNHGGLETQNKTLVEGLHRLGHEVEVFAPKLELSDSEIIQNGVKYIFVPAVYRMGSIFSPIESLLVRLLPKYFSNISQIISPKGKEDWVEKSFMYVMESHKVSPFHVVLCQSSSGLGILRKKDDLGIKVISISHGSILGEYRTRLKSISNASNFLSPIFVLRFVRDTFYVLANYFGRQREFVLTSDHIIAVSSYVKKALMEETFVAESKVTVVFNGVSLSHSNSMSVKKDYIPHIVYVGRVLRDKGLFVLLDALSLLDNAFMLTVVGTGEDLAELKEYSKTKNISDRVTFTGHVSYDNVLAYLKNSDIFVLPSLRIEGFPMTIVEAMLCGLPCIVSDIGGNSDAVVDQTTGYLVKSGDKNDLRDKLALLLSDESLRKQLGTNAKLKAENEFSVDVMLSNYIKVINQVLKL